MPAATVAGDTASKMRLGLDATANVLQVIGRNARTVTTLNQFIKLILNSSLSSVGVVVRMRSIMFFNNTELQDAADNGAEGAINNLSSLLRTHNVSAGDLIQFSGAVAVSNCPGAPSLEFLAGRPNATFPAQAGTVSLPQDPVDKILSRVEDAGLTPEDTVNLLVSYTVARSDTLVSQHTAVPFDTTPFTFDSQVFLEVLLKGTGVPPESATPMVRK